MVKMYDFKINCIDLSSLVTDVSLLPPPKVPTKPGPLAVKRKSKGDRRRTVKRNAVASTSGVEDNAYEMPISSSSAAGWQLPPIPVTENVHLAAPSTLSTTATPPSVEVTERSAPVEQSALLADQQQPTTTSKRTRKVGACPHCGWSHYFGVTMCSAPIKPIGDSESAHANSLKSTPAPVICSQCHWTHDVHRTPCRHPAKKN